MRPRRSTRVAQRSRTAHPVTAFENDRAASCVGEERDLVRRPGRDPERVGRAERAHRADDDAAAEERVVRARPRPRRRRTKRKFATAGPSGLEAVLAEHAPRARPSPRGSRRAGGRSRRRRRGSRARPPGPGVVTSNARRTFAIAAITSRGPDPVADPQPGEAVDLRERPQHEHAAAALRVLLDRVRDSPGRRRTRSTPGRRP